MALVIKILTHKFWGSQYSNHSTESILVVEMAVHIEKQKIRHPLYSREIYGLQKTPPPLCKVEVRATYATIMHLRLSSFQSLP